MTDKKSSITKEDLVDNQHRSDILFLVGVNAKKIFGHKLLLEVANEVFYAMVNHGLSEETDRCEVKIPDIEPEIFLELLRFLYCETTNITKENLVELYAAADKYLMEDLKECLKAITVKNVMYVYICNQNRNFFRVTIKCLDIMESDPLVAFAQDDFNNLKQDDLEIIFRVCRTSWSYRLVLFCG